MIHRRPAPASERHALARRALVGPSFNPLVGPVRVRATADARDRVVPDAQRCDRRAPKGWRCPSAAVAHGRCADHPRGGMARKKR